MEKSPKAHAKETLKTARAGVELEGEPHVKAEAYGIAAYFIEKATERALTWLADNPDHALVQQINQVDDQMVNSSVVVVEDVAAHLSSRNLKRTLRQISALIEGLLHQHVLEVMNPDAPAPLPNPDDEDIQERLRSLLLHSFGDRQPSFQAREFVLSATRAPAVFIPTALHGGLHAYHHAFGALPSIAELDTLKQKLAPVLLKLAQFNILDIETFNRGTFGDLTVDQPLPVTAFDDSLQLERVGDEYRLVLTELVDYSNAGTEDEPTVGCPAVYTKANGQNTIRHMLDYGTGLLQRSAVYRD